MGIRHVLPTARHQQTNGLPEKIVQVVKNTLRKFRHAGIPLETLLPAIALALNSRPHSATGHAPLELAFGISSPPHQWAPSANRDAKLDSAITSLLNQADQRELSYNKRTTSYPAITINSWVLLDRNGINWPAAQLESLKLLPRRIGPFKVIAVDSFHNYHLDLPAHWRIHPHFARPLLSEYFFHDRNPTMQPLLPSTSPNLGEASDDTPEPEYTVEAVLGIRKEDANYFGLVKWAGYGTEENSWEPFDHLTHSIDLLRQYITTSGQWTELLPRLKSLCATSSESNLLTYATPADVSVMDMTTPLLHTAAISQPFLLRRIQKTMEIHLNLCSRQYAFDFRVRRSQGTRLATLLWPLRPTRLLIHGATVRLMLLGYALRKGGCCRHGPLRHARGPPPLSALLRSTFPIR